MKKPKLTAPQKKLLAYLRAQKQAAKKEPGGGFSNGWTLGSSGCKRNVATALLKKGLVTFEPYHTGHVVCVKD